MASEQDLARQASKRSLLLPIQINVLNSLFGLSPTVLNLLENILRNGVHTSWPRSGIIRVSRFSMVGVGLKVQDGWTSQGYAKFSTHPNHLCTPL